MSQCCRVKKHKKVKGFLEIGINMTFEKLKGKYHFKCNKCLKYVPSYFGATLPETSCQACLKRGDFAFNKERQNEQLDYNKYSKKDEKYQKRIYK